MPQKPHDKPGFSEDNTPTHTMTTPSTLKPRKTPRNRLTDGSFAIFLSKDEVRLLAQGKLPQTVKVKAKHRLAMLKAPVWGEKKPSLRRPTEFENAEQGDEG